MTHPPRPQGEAVSIEQALFALINTPSNHVGDINARANVIRELFAALQSQVEELRREVAGVRYAAQDQANHDAAKYQRLQAQLTARESEVAGLREALRKYGDHYPECAVIQECGRAVKPGCSWGFSAALSRGEGEKHE